MLAIQISMNVFLFAAGGILCVLLGFMLRQGQLKKAAKQIIELEKEMLRSHSEIIDLHRQIDLVTNQTKPGATILKLNDGPIGDEQSNLPDVSTRKKLLGKASNLK